MNLSCKKKKYSNLLLVHSGLIVIKYPIEIYYNFNILAFSECPVSIMLYIILNLDEGAILMNKNAEIVDKMVFIKNFNFNRRMYKNVYKNVKLLLLSIPNSGYSPPPQ